HGKEGRQDVSFIAGDYLSGVHQPGAARRPVRLRLAVDLPGAGGAGLLGGSYLHDHRGRDRGLQPAERPAYPPSGDREGDGDQRGHDGGGPVRVLCEPFVLVTVSVGGPLWAGGRERGRSEEHTSELQSRFDLV